MRWLRSLAGRLRPPALWVGAALGVTALVAVIHSRLYAGVVIDDAFISYRHAQHLVRGEGFTCNPGTRIEGTSSALFALLMALPIGIGADPHELTGWLGSLLLAGCAAIAYVTVLEASADRWGRGLGIGAAALVAMSARLAFHSQTGMETLTYALLVALGFWLHLRAVAGKKPAWAWACVMGLAACTRPEGVCFFLLLFLLGGFQRRREVGLARRLGCELSAFLAVWGPLLLFRLLYFGRVLPMSVHAKRGATDWAWSQPPAHALHNLLLGSAAGIFYRFLSAHALGAALLCGALLLSATRYAATAIACMLAGAGAVLVWNGGDWMPHGRLLVPYLPLLAVGTAWGLRALLFHSEQRSRRGHHPSVAVTTLTFSILLWGASRPLEKESTATVDLGDARQLGERLAKLRRSDDVVASDMAGVLPYYWDAPTIDIYGLCDAYVAEHGQLQPNGAGRSDLAYVATLRPTFYAFNERGMARSFFHAEYFAPQRADYFLLAFPPDTFRSASLAPALLVRKDRLSVGEMAQALGARLLDAGEGLERRP